MKRKIKKIDYKATFAQTVAEDHRIGDDILLLDEFVFDPVSDYEFVSAGNTFFEVLEGGGTLSVNGVSYPVEGHCLIVYFQGQVVRATSTTTILCSALQCSLTGLWKNCTMIR